MHLCHVKQHVQMVAYVIWIRLILLSWHAYWCDDILKWKQGRPQVEWTLNRWATKVWTKPHPSALITVDESHVAWPIKPHYLDRENMREQKHWFVKGGGVEIAIISYLLADLPGEVDIFGGPQKHGGDFALLYDSCFVSSWCPFFQINIDFAEPDRLSDF